MSWIPNRLARLCIQSVAILMILGAMALPSQAQTRDRSSSGVDIVVFDIVDSVSKAAGRPAGGGGGGDILVWDIVDSATRTSANSDVSKLTNYRVFVLGESAVPGIYEAVVDTGESLALAWLWEVGEPRTPHIQLQIIYGF